MGQDLLVTNASHIATPKGAAAARGKAMSDIAIIRDAAILVKDGMIEYAGPEHGLPAPPPGIRTLDAKGKAIIPGFVDSHTHFVFGGDRADEFFWRAEGLPYMAIHERGGGIRNSVRATRAAPLEALVERGERVLASMLEHGVTTVEGKSGYGLDKDTELRQLEAMRILSERQSVRIERTFMGAHSIPDDYKGRNADYVDFVVGSVLPEVVARGLARYCDVFCEKGVFSVDESRTLLLAARKSGLGIKIHADEIERLGGAGLAAELGAVSADHLLKASHEDIRAMADANVVATCLPLTAFCLREPYADARAMIDSGCAVAIATDFNPGSCHSNSIPLAIALSVLYMKLSMEETLTALTLNGAAAIGLAGELGTIEPGKRADFSILADDDYRFLAYRTGVNRVDVVVKDGAIVRDARR